MSGIGLLQNSVTLLQLLVGLATVDIGWRQQRQASVVMLVVVPVEERSAPRSGIDDGTEASWVVRSILERLELRL
jgi:hypothetical protein